MRAASVMLLLALGCSGCKTRDFFVGDDLKATPDAALAPAASSDMATADAAASPAPPAPDAGTRAPSQAAPAGEPPACADTQTDCDGDPSNGCEVDLATDRANCGQCGNACSSEDCGCRAGKLAANCAPGRADCDGSARNGCEVDSDISMQHCGGCGRVCHANGHDAVSAICAAGRCLITCEAPAPLGEQDCDGDAENGCEAELLTDDQNCGACGVRCRCERGACDDT